MFRILASIIALITLALPTVAAAQVRLSFHSFNGSWLGGRYPHTFIVLEGTLDATGQAINENYGILPSMPVLPFWRAMLPVRS